MNTVNTIKRRLVAARAVLVLDHPFFGALSLRMNIEEETRGRTRTMATDGRSLFYDKDYVRGCSDQELVGLFAHEVIIRRCNITPVGEIGIPDCGTRRPTMRSTQC